MASRMVLIVAFVVMLILTMGCGTPAPTPTAVPQPTQTSPPPTDPTPTAVLQPTHTSPPPTEPPPLPPTALAPTEPPTLPPATQAPTDTPQPPAAAATPLPTAESAPRRARVTFVNNAGFLITVGDKKVLIDALYVGNRQGISKPVVDARPPFDAIDLILVTHEHPDHFSPDLVARAMSQNPEAVFVSTQRVVERLLGADGSLRERAIPIQLQAGESEQLDVNGIGLEALYISHGEPNLLNLGFVITVGDIRFFHTGDSTPNDISVSYLQSYGLPETQLDVAFVPYFYLTTQKYHAYALEGIQARYVIPMHYETRHPPLGVEDDFPNAVVFHYALQSWVLPLAAEATPATSGNTLSPTSTEMPTSTSASAPTIPLDGRGGGLIAFYSERDGNAEIYIMNADGSAETRLTHNRALDLAPDLSPGGSQIVFVSNRDGNEEIYKMNWDGSDVVRLTHTPTQESYPYWSSDGTRIVFCSRRDDGRTYEVYLMNSDGTDQTRITNNSVSEEWAYLSPDMQRIVYAVGPFPHYSIYVMNLDGSDQHQIFSSERGAAIPKWSRDGRTIASNHFDFSSGNLVGDILLMNDDGSNARQITESTSNSVSENPYWSPDGSRIVFQSNRDGNFEIYTLNVEDALQGSEGSGPLRLTDTGAGDFWPSWGPFPGAAPASEDLDNVIVHTHVCGFLVASGGKRILIDSLFRVDDPPTPSERVHAMRQGLPPFDGIDLILVTHDHHDHFDANLVGDNMLNNPDAVFVSTDVAVNKLKDRFPEFAQIQDRVVGIHLERGEREQMNVAGIDLEVFFLSHGVPTVPNFGYLFAVDDVTFFHTGDINPEYVTTADLQAVGLPERKIDIAFVSGFRLADERFSDRILEGIQPKFMVPMHFNFTKPYDDSVLREVEASFQNVILFREEMTSQSIDLEVLE